jgi:hypothetical protein
MSVKVIAPPFKPTFHRGLLPPEWQTLRDHVTAVFMIWERGHNRIFSGGNLRATFLNATWVDLKDGPALHFSGNGYVDTFTQDMDGVGLFAGGTQPWTLAVRFRAPASTVGTVVARASATAANKTFQMFLDRPTSAGRTPRFEIRGVGTDTSWGLDDNRMHTVWVVWNGSTLVAYFDDAKGALTLAVGTAAEEAAEVIMFGARTRSLPASFLTGDIDFVALVDVPLTPAAIVEWNRDIYAPWRPQRQWNLAIVQSAPPSVVVSNNLVTREESLELWSDVEENGGTRRAVLSQILTLEEEADISGMHTITFSIPLNHPAVTLIDTPEGRREFQIDQVIRFVKPDNTYTQHRIDRVNREVRPGNKTLHISAASIIEDLTTHGVVSRTNANGSSEAKFISMGLTMKEHIETYVLPALREGGQYFWEVGSMAHSRPIDVPYENDTPQSALRKIAEIGGDLEPSVTILSGDFRINVTKQVGAGLEPVYVRTNQNLLDMGFTERTGDQANRVYAFGSVNQDGVQAVIGQAEWEILSIFLGPEGMDIELGDPSGGEGPIAFNNQFVPIPGISLEDEDPTDPAALIFVSGHYYLKVTTGGEEWSAAIIATFAELGTVEGGTQVAGRQNVRVNTTVMPPTPPPGAGRTRVKIVADSTGREILYTEHPEAVEDYGVRVGILPRDDIPPTNNLMPNPVGRNWPTGATVPTLWQFSSPATISRETNPRFWEHGGKAIRAILPFNSSIVSPRAILPLDATGPISFFVRMTVLKGKASVWINLARPTLDPEGAPNPSLPYRDFTGLQYTYPDNYGDLLTEPETQLPNITNQQLGVMEDIGKDAVWDLNQLPLYGGQILIGVSNRDSTQGNVEVVISGIQVTLSSRQQPLMEGSGGVRLHHAANQRVGTYGKPARTITVNLIDLAFESGMRFPYEPLKLGAPIIVEETESDTYVRTRLVKYKRDWRKRLMPTVDVSHIRPAMSSMISARTWPERRMPSLSDVGIRGLTYPGSE